MISFGLCEDAARIRKEVFVEEQGFQKEFDEIDPIALHVVLYRDGEPAATGRLFRRDRAAIEAMGTGGGQTRLAGDVNFDGGRVESTEEAYRRETAAGDGLSLIHI